jgi:hypothetical protein
LRKNTKEIVKVVFHDVWTDKGRKDAEPYNIRVIPTQVFLDENGVEFFRHEGFFAKEKIVEINRRSQLMGEQIKKLSIFEKSLLYGFYCV